jgi:hypothetical protein
VGRLSSIILKRLKMSYLLYKRVVVEKFKFCTDIAIVIELCSCITILYRTRVPPHVEGVMFFLVRPRKR